MNKRLPARIGLVSWVKTPFLTSQATWSQVVDIPNFHKVTELCWDLPIGGALGDTQGSSPDSTVTEHSFIDQRNPKRDFRVVVN